MNNLSTFLNVRIENSGALAWIGDKGLAPFRYLFNGRTVRIRTGKSDQVVKIHHVASFHKNGWWNFSRTNMNFHSSRTSMIKTALAVVLLIPGLILGAAIKGVAYLFSDVRKKHHLAKEHLTPINREIGSASNPIKTRDELAQALEVDRKSDPKNRQTNALIIYGDGALTINENTGILVSNPKKLILVGAKIVCEQSDAARLCDVISETGKWLTNAVHIATVDDALRTIAPKRSWSSSKRYHMIFNVARPQVI